MSYLGSWKIDDLLTFVVNTQVFATGVATDADSPPAYRVYEDETTTPILTGTMALIDSANTAGFYSEQITLSAANGFEKGKSYSVYISATVSSVAGATHRNFQIEAEVDAHRLNWANIDNPTTAQNLSGTNIDVDQVVASVTGAVGSVTGAVGSVGAGGITAASIATDAIDADALADNAITAATFAAGAITAAVIATGAIDADAIADNAIDAGAIANGAIDAATFAAGAIDAAAIADGAIDAATFAAGAITATVIATGAIDADALATDAVAEIADGVWDEAIAGHLSAGSTGEALDTAGGSGASAADIADAVWDEATAGHTTSGTFGEQLKTDVDAILDDTDDIGVAGAGLTVLATQASVDDLPTNAELATSQAAADDATLAAIAALVIPTAVENADALLGRDMSAVAGAADRSPLNAMRFNRNKFTIVGGVLTVFEEDDVTPAWTATITQTAGDPVSASDPA